MSDVEGSNFGDTSTFVDIPENNIGSFEQFIGNFLAEPGDLSNIVKSKIWVTSDTHFHHRNILKYEAESRPFKDRDDMDEILIQRWNDKVGKSDVVFHLGDFAFAGKSVVNSIVSRLNGQIFLLLGNHDRQNKKWNWEELGFSRMFKQPFIMDGKFIFSHEPLAEIPDGKVNIYGHVHGSKYFNTKDDNRICVCVERWNCAPIEYEYIKGMY